MKAIVISLLCCGWLGITPVAFSAALEPVTIGYSTFSVDTTIMKGIEQSGFIKALYKTK